MRRSTALAIFRVFLLIGLTVYIIVIQGLTLLLRLPFARQLPVHWHGWCCRAIGMQLIVSGRPSGFGPSAVRFQPCLVYRYRRAWLCFGCEFFARADVRGWPVFGFLATLQRTIFVERKPRFARQQMRELSDRLATGDRLICFPKGRAATVMPFCPSRAACLQRPRSRSMGIPSRYSRFPLLIPGLTVSRWAVCRGQSMRGTATCSSHRIFGTCWVLAGFVSNLRSMIR